MERQFPNWSVQRSQMRYLYFLFIDKFDSSDEPEDTGGISCLNMYPSCSHNGLQMARLASMDPVPTKGEA